MGQLFFRLHVKSCRLLGTIKTHRKMRGGSSNSSRNGEWDSLPLTVAFLILDRLLEPAYHVRFAAICKHYGSLAKDYNQLNRLFNKALLPPPMLLILDKDRPTLATLCSVVSEGRIYKNVELHYSTQRWRCCGSSHGWLATVLDDVRAGSTIALRNLFKKPSTTICLPKLKVFSITKVVLSADPTLNQDSYVVGVIHGYKGLAFIRANERHWICIEETSNIWDDIIFYKSQIYAVGRRGEIVSVNLDGNNHNVPEAKLLTPENPFPHIDRERAYLNYLAESTKGDLLCIQRVLSRSTIYAKPKINGFKVYKVVFSDGDGSAVEQLLETRSIGDEALFVHNKNAAISVSTSNFPKCKPNSIYYTTDGYLKCPNGMSTFVFNLEDGTIKQPHPLSTMQRIALNTMQRKDTLQGHWIMPFF
ncbi:putative F-box protein At5g66830 [Argentina anserina]|uniref:putative F-box protein At5g66830 n=1 Tax=Argentina anserina TaxID=57926 RepID=UPI0021767B0C|nr:putative F-box protein At5g66830 [Potentilla anserina]